MSGVVENDDFHFFSVSVSSEPSEIRPKLLYAVPHRPSRDSEIDDPK